MWNVKCGMESEFKQEQQKYYNQFNISMIPNCANTYNTTHEGNDSWNLSYYHRKRK